MAITETKYETPRDFDSAAELLRSLITARRLLKATLAESAVATAFELVGRKVSTGASEERLQAISLLGKAAEISKPLATYVQPFLIDGLRSPLSRTGSWGTAVDRYYLAKALSLSSESWVTPYAAVELAQAEVDERKSREVWADIAINRSENLASAIETISAALSEDRKASNFRVDTASRKLNRIASAMVEPLSVADVPLGEDFGKAFSNLVRQATSHEGPDNRRLREETAVNVLDVMIQMLRLRFAVALDPDVYRAAGLIQRWWKPARPSEPVRSRSERIAKIGMDALHMLSRQGIAQRNLRQALVSAFGAEVVDRIGGEITSRDSSLDAGISSWLATGKDLADRKSNPAVRQVNEQEFDELLANLLLAIENQESQPQVLELLSDEIELLEPTQAKTIRGAASRSRLIDQWAQAVAGKRRLAVAGERGQIVQFDPALHETEDEIQLSAKARIMTPGVIKQEEGRPSVIILKTRVERP